MKELIITPQLAQEVELRNKPAFVSISKMNIALNGPATKLLALKSGVQFQLVLKNGKLYYKDSPDNGFTITGVKMKGASLVNRGLHIILCEEYHENDSTFRFEIGEIKEGLRLLTDAPPKSNKKK
jgi:hypothetical protein